MWVPENEEDILQATKNDSLEETLTFDAKRELPDKNAEIAKDLSAMANTAGGVIIFGIGEDESGRPTVPIPFDLKGKREKIDSIIRTSVSEVPGYEITAVKAKTNAKRGYIVLLIPPLERAPHMVVVKGERRYYGRGETGNYILSEPEIARLYERRSLSTLDFLPVLETQILKSPIPDHNGFIHLNIVARPVLQDDSMLEKAADAFSIDYGGQVNSPMFLDSLIDKVREPDIFPKDRYHINFPKPPGWIRQPTSFLGELFSAYRDDATPNANTLSLEVGLDGSGALFCGFIGRTVKNDQQTKKLFYPDIAASNLTRFVTFFGILFCYASYFGKVDIGVALTGLKGCKGIRENYHDYHFAYEFKEDNYRTTNRFSAETLNKTPREVSAKLIMPFISTIYQGQLNPFAEITRE